MRSLIVICLLCSPAVAGTFRTDAYDVQVRVGDNLNQTESTLAGVPFEIITDYETARWQIDLTGVRVNVSGSPTAPFESYLEFDGTITSSDVDLSFPNADGLVLLANADVDFNVSWSFTERIVNVTNVHHGGRSELVSVPTGPIYRASINVSEHPHVLHWAGRTNHYLGHPLGNGTGLHLGSGDGVSVGLAGVDRFQGTPEPLAAWNPGDFNDDGAVSAADFVLARNAPGLAPLLAPETVWRENFHPSGAAAVAIPEPSAAVLVFLAVCVGWPRRAR